MPEREVTQQRWWPEEPTIGNYSLYFDVEGRTADVGAAIARQFPRAIVNSLIIGTAVMLLNLICGSLAAYALSRLPFRGNLLLLLFYLGSRSVPGVAIMIPMYLLMRSYGLLDTHLSVILSHTTFTLPFTIWILKGYFPDRAPGSGTGRAGRRLHAAGRAAEGVSAGNDARAWSPWASSPSSRPGGSSSSLCSSLPPSPPGR